MRILCVFEIVCKKSFIRLLMVLVSVLLSMIVVMSPINIISPHTAFAIEQPVDIFIGDSSAINASNDSDKTNRWTRLFADADGAYELNAAVGGTGYLVGGDNAYSHQLDLVLTRMKEEHISADCIRRVFLVGGGNDFAIANTPYFSERLIATANHVAFRIGQEFPNAQKLYIPEMAPATDRMLKSYRSLEPYFPSYFAMAYLHGFQYDKNWYQWVTDPDANGYVIADETHLTAKGHNEAAHRVVAWVNTLNGPKVKGTVPEWGGDTTPVLRFSANGGWGSVPSVRAAAGTDVSIPSSASGSGSAVGHTPGSGIADDNRELVSWNTEPDGSGTSYQPGSYTAMPPQSTVLYAQWRALPARSSGAERVLTTGAASSSAVVLAVAAGLTVTHHQSAIRGRGRRGRRGGRHAST